MVVRQHEVVAFFFLDVWIVIRHQLDFFVKLLGFVFWFHLFLLDRLACGTENLGAACTDATTARLDLDEVVGQNSAAFFFLRLLELPHFNEFINVHVGVSIFIWIEKHVVCFFAREIET